MDKTTTTSKPWYKSKTVWFNLISTAVVFTDGLAKLIVGLYDFIPAEVYPWVVFGIGISNLFLRSITSTALLRGDE
jgi:hypothetical protein